MRIRLSICIVSVIISAIFNNNVRLFIMSVYGPWNGGSNSAFYSHEVDVGMPTQPQQVRADCERNVVSKEAHTPSKAKPKSSIRQSWTLENDGILRDVIARVSSLQNTIKWTQVAFELRDVHGIHGFSGNMLCHHWKYLQGQVIERSGFSAEENTFIFQSRYGANNNWVQIADELNDKHHCNKQHKRTCMQVRDQYYAIHGASKQGNATSVEEDQTPSPSTPLNLSEKVVVANSKKKYPLRQKFRWTASLDKWLLAEMQNNHFNGKRVKWRKIANAIQTMSGGIITGKKVYHHWHCYLDPAIDKSSFTLVEDAVIVGLVKSHGCKWAQIADMINSQRTIDRHLRRTDMQIKNRYSSLIKKIADKAQV